MKHSVAGRGSFGLARNPLSIERPSPIRSEGRLVILDVLRGFALLGILLLNIELFSGPESLHDVPVGTAKQAFTGWHASLDLVIFSVKWVFFEGKMRTLFSMLFGAGIVLLTERLEAKGGGGRAAYTFLRRNLWLLLFGLMHGTLIWEGDILSQYAFIALLFMFPLRRVAARPLIAIGLVIGILGGTWGVSRLTDARNVLATDDLRNEGRRALVARRTPSPAQAMALQTEAREHAEAPAAIALRVKEGRQSFWDGLHARTNSYFSILTGLFSTGWILEVIGSMLLGMGLYKTGFLTASRSWRTYVATALVGYGISMPIVLTGVVMSSSNGFSASSVTYWMFLPYSLQVFAGSLANTALLVLVFKRGWFRKSFAALANVGRMAFSNYIFTSVICQILFAWGPWKLYGSIEYYQQLYVIVCVWGVNICASALWMRYFQYGPLEWVWRSLTYWRVQPMRNPIGPARS